LEGTGRCRLLTEAEWTYAAKAGTVPPWSFGADPAAAGGYAWYRANSGMETRPAAGKFPTPWGLFGKHANVWERVSGWYGAGWYLESLADDLQGPAAGEERVVRGGRLGQPPAPAALRQQALPAALSQGRERGLPRGVHAGAFEEAPLSRGRESPRGVSGVPAGLPGGPGKPEIRCFGLSLPGRVWRVGGRQGATWHCQGGQEVVMSQRRL
jgi:hypothetical protein